MKVTVSKFQELYQISLMELTDLEKSTLFVQALTGLSPEKVDSMNVRKFEKVCAKVTKSFNSLTEKIKGGKPKNWIWANGRLYFLSYDITKMNAGDYVEIAAFGQDVIGNLHKILATMATPCKLGLKGIVKVERDHEDISNDMLELDFETAYQMSVFFCAVFKNSINSILSSLSQEDWKLAEAPLKDFLRVSDGYTMPNWYLNLRELA